jgi:hypothetical protein
VEFKRKQRIKGKTAKHHKEWYDETKQYRIIWRDQVFDVDVQPGYSACIRCLRSRGDDFAYWGFAGRRGLYKSRQAAIKACEENKQAWNKFLAIEGRAKVTQFRNLEARTVIGHGKTAHSTMRDLPTWVIKEASPRLLEVLCGNDQDDLIATSRNFSIEDSHEEDAPGPVNNVLAADESGTQTTYPTSSKETSSDDESNVESAKAPAAAPKKHGVRRTATSSTSGKKKRKSTTAAKKSTVKRSRSSRKKKKKPSGS